MKRLAGKVGNRINARLGALHPAELGTAGNEGSQIWWGTHHDLHRGGLYPGIGRNDDCTAVR